MARRDTQEVLSLVANPRSIALFGASEDPTKLGHVAIKLLKEGKYSGRIIPINPRGGEILGLPVARDLSEAGGPVDVAVSFVPAAQMLGVLEQCEANGVHAVIGVTSGFAESGGAGAEYEKALKTFLATSRLRLLGPNCEGIVFPGNDLLLSFSPMFIGLKPGGIAIVSQSGAISGMMANRLSRNGGGIHSVITTGNESDISASDVLEWLGNDDSCDVVLMYVEQIRDAKRFVAAARAMRGKKRIVINKVGRSGVGQRAALSHTGALAGDDRVVEGVFDELGIVRATDTMNAVDSATALSLGKTLQGDRIAVISLAGGLGVETAELCEMAKFQVLPFDPGLQQKIAKHLPFFGSASNPVDLTGAIISRPNDLRQILDLAVADDSIDAVIVVLTFARNLDFARHLIESAQLTEKPLIVCWTGSVEQTPEALAMFREKSFPTFDSPARAVGALIAIAVASRNLEDA
ncbi:MAG: CoA-binding protein [Pseudolabrys sp.]|nr:CoA-binding protein [Pseudolabrys sp.]